MAPSGRPPVVADDLLRLAKIFPGSPLGAALLTALYWLRSNQQGWPTGPLELIKTRPVLRGVWIFAILRTISNALSRLALNPGWKRDRPNWKSPNEIVVITGGARGIGAGFVDLLAKKTKRIAVLDMVEPTYKAKGIKYYKCDITNKERIHEVAEEIRRDLGHPTILINNAGIAQGERLLDYTEETWMRTYKINILGALLMVQEFLPHMIVKNHGHVQMIASMSAYMSVPQLGEYCCTKSAGVAFHEVLTQELRHRYGAPRVRTSLICPNKVSTDLGNHMAPNVNEFVNPTLTVDEVTKVMLGHIESGLSGSSVLPPIIGSIAPLAKALPPWLYEGMATAGQLHRTITDDSRTEGRKNVGAGSLLANIVSPRMP